MLLEIGSLRESASKGRLTGGFGMSDEKDTVEVPRVHLQAWIEEIRRLRKSAAGETPPRTE